MLQFGPISPGAGDLLGKNSHAISLLQLLSWFVRLTAHWPPGQLRWCRRSANAGGEGGLRILVQGEGQARE